VDRARPVGSGVSRIGSDEGQPAETEALRHDGLAGGRSGGDHYRRKEPQMIIVNAVIFALAVFVAWGRFGPYSF
jgi:hypothetical protein